MCSKSSEGYFATKMLCNHCEVLLRILSATAFFLGLFMTHSVWNSPFICPHVHQCVDMQPLAVMCGCFAVSSFLLFLSIVHVDYKKQHETQVRQHSLRTFSSVSIVFVCEHYLPCLLRQRQSDASPVFELWWVVDTGSCELWAAWHTRQTSLGPENKDFFKIKTYFFMLHLMLITKNP